MLATTKIHQNHILAKRKAVLGTRGTENYQRRARHKNTAGGKDGGHPSLDDLEVFRKQAHDSFPFQTLHRDNVISQTAGRRSTVVPIVKKRVEMLNINAISREFTQALVRLVLVLVSSHDAKMIKASPR